MGDFLPKMPVAFRADSDSKTTERNSAHWRNPVMSREKKHMCVPFPFPFLSFLCTFSHSSAMNISLGVSFLWKSEIITLKVNACPVYCQTHHCFYSNVPGLQLSTRLLQGRAALPANL